MLFASSRNEKYVQHWLFEIFLGLFSQESDDSDMINLLCGGSIFGDTQFHANDDSTKFEPAEGCVYSSLSSIDINILYGKI